MERNEIFGSQPQVGEHIDASAVLGTWRNSNEKTIWIAGFTLAQNDGAYTLDLEGCGEVVDLQNIPVTFYKDNIGELAFSAQADLGFAQVLLAANMNKGLWVIAAFYTFCDDSERPNFLCREFYFRED